MLKTFDNSLQQKLAADCLYMRKKSLEMAYNAGNVGAHLGGGLSLIEIMAVLYGSIMNYYPAEPFWPKRDRLILSKGHGTLAFYTALALAGYITEEELMTYKSNDTFLYGHPYANIEKGIEFSSGSLGLGLSLGIGSALAAKRKNIDYRAFVILGDGEINEGTVWEAAMAAAHFKLNNLIAIIDSNGLQYDGATENVMNMDSQEAKWQSFGWATSVVDGHNLQEIFSALSKVTERPHAIIAKTVKGKGVSFMENNRAWHHSVLTKTQFEQAMAEQEGSVL